MLTDLHKNYSNKKKKSVFLSSKGKHLTSGRLGVGLGHNDDCDHHCLWSNGSFTTCYHWVGNLPTIWCI